MTTIELLPYATCGDWSGNWVFLTSLVSEPPPQVEGGVELGDGPVSVALSRPLEAVPSSELSALLAEIESQLQRNGWTADSTRCDSVAWEEKSVCLLPRGAFRFGNRVLLVCEYRSYEAFGAAAVLVRGKEIESAVLMNIGGC